MRNSGKTLVFVLLASLAVLGLGGCSNQYAGGGTSGSEAGNALSLQVVTTKGALAARAAVTVRPSDYVPGDTLNARYTLATNDSGMLRLDSLPQGEWVVEVSDSVSSLLLTLHITSEDSSVELGRQMMHKHSTVTGYLPLPLVTGTVVVVPGTEHQVIPAADGSFQLNHMPSAILSVRAIAGSQYLQGYVAPLPGETVKTGQLRNDDLTTLVLDDFSDSNSQSRFGALMDGGWWWLSGSEDVIIQRPASTASYPVPLIWEGVNHGMVIRFSADFDSASTLAWLDLGVQIGANNAAYDLTHVDSIAFWVRGQGDAKLTLHLAPYDPLFTEPSALVNIPSEWTRISVPVSSMMNSVSESGVLQRVSQISWVFTSNADVWLDDVSLIGATHQQIWGE